MAMSTKSYQEFTILIVELLFVRKPSRKERDELYYLLGDKNLKPKVLIILLSYEDCEVREIARRLGIHPETARRWIRKFNKLGLKAFFRRPGRKKELTAKVERRILEVALKKPDRLPFSTWSLRKLEYYVNRKLGIKMSHTQIRNVLLKHGLKFRKARSRILSTNPEYEAKKKRVERLMRRPNSVVMFQDEKVMVAKEYLGYEWCLEARIVLRNQKIKGKFYVYWFYDWHDKKLYKRYFDKLSKKNFFHALGWDEQENR
jgi:transposase